MLKQEDMSKSLRNLYKIEFDFEKKMYAELNGGGVGLNDVSNAKESNINWGDIWSVGK